MHKRTKFGAALLLIMALVLSGLGFKSAEATADTSAQVECVPSDAYIETIEHPEVSHVVHHEAVTHEETVVDQEATPEVWANWSPNHQQGPFVGPPSYPTDSRGTWHVRNQIPGGHAGPDGVYQRDNPGYGNGDWFYRHNGTPEVTHVVVIVDAEAYDETVVDVEAYTETIVHPAVTCEGDPVVDVPTVNVPTVNVPTVDEPAVRSFTTQKCGQDNSIVTQEYDSEKDEWVTTHIEALPFDTSKCDAKKGDTFIEEGF